LSSNGDKAKLVGKWKCEKNMAKFFNDGIASGDPSLAEYIALDDFTIVVYMEFYEDDTYAIYADEDSVEDAIELMKEELVEDLSRYLEETILESTGLSLPVEQILEMAGLTMDGLMAEIVTDELVDEMVDGIASKGKFKAEDGKLFTSAGLEYEVDPAVYETYTLEDDVLTLLEYVGGEEDAPDEAVYPMVFKKLY
jgi:hypothetical protein